VAVIHVSRMDTMGSDLTVANAARVSFAKHKEEQIGRASCRERVLDGV